MSSEAFTRQAIIEAICPCRPLGDRMDRVSSYFFGYYNKTVWDRTGSYILGNKTAFRDAQLHPQLWSEVGLFDVSDHAYHTIDVTSAWNWQMGCQLQWLGGVSPRRVIYNVRSETAGGPYRGFASRIRDLDSGMVRDLPLPIYVVSPDGRYALCIDYSRLYVTHETIGYGPRPDALANAPDDDGIRHMDLDSGRSVLILSYGDLARFHPVSSMKNAIHWVSHLELNPAGNRVVFLHRWTERVEDETCFLHRLMTMDPDGGNLRLLECSDHPLPQLEEDFDPLSVGTFEYEKSPFQISHPAWRDDTHIVAWSPHDGEIHYHLYRDVDGGDVLAIHPDILTENGHMTFSPTDKRWLLSDTYPDALTDIRTLFLLNVDSGIRFNIGRFRADPNLSKENRCDLHPRWSRDGSKVCIDSMHEGPRKMYVVDVSEVVKA